MARARNIKPGFFRNEVLAELDPTTRLLFAGLWTIADRAGRLEDRPKRIKADVLPYDDGDVSSMLEALARRSFIARYKHGASSYIQILNFDKHQNPHRSERDSEIPPMDDADQEASSPADNDDQKPEESGKTSEHPTNTVQAPESHSTNRADSLVTDSHDSGIPGGDARAREAPRRKHKIPDDFAVTDEMRAWVIEKTDVSASSIDAETEKFRDHFTANGETKVDWIAAWRNWIRRSPDFGPRSRRDMAVNGQARASPPKPLEDMTNEEAEAWYFRDIRGA